MWWGRDVCLSQWNTEWGQAPVSTVLASTAQSSQTGYSCGTAEGTEPKRRAPSKSQRTQKRTESTTRGRGHTSSFSLLSQEAKSKCEQDRFTSSTWEVSSRPQQEADSLLRAKVQTPLRRSREAWGKGQILFNVCEEGKESWGGTCSRTQLNAKRSKAHVCIIFFSC